MAVNDQLPAGMRNNWNFKLWTEKDITEKLPGVLSQMKTLYDKAGTADINNLSFDTLLQPLLQAQRLTFGNNWWYGTLGSPIVFPKLVAVQKEVRDAASKAGKAMDDLTLEMFMRADIFDRLVKYKKMGCDLDPEYVRFVDRMIIEGRKNGLQLNEEQRTLVKQLKTEISSLTQEFEQNLSEDGKIVLLDESELTGVPEDFINGLQVDEATRKKKLTMKYPDYLPVMQKCRIPETRRKIAVAYNNRGGTRNEEIMRSVIRMRQECANLLGYRTWAAYRMDVLMSKNPETVDGFLKTLTTKLHPLWAAEKNAMLKLKKEECETFGYQFNDELEMWDLGYYCNMIEEKEYSIDNNMLKEYFPLATVTNGMLGIYSQILGLEYTKIEDPQTWHEDVLLYRVNDKESGELMGYVYMDLFPRDGKFTHFCNHPIQSGALNDAGVKEKTVTCMICNFNPPTADKPSLLTPNEVTTYFHEFGHAMHAICSKAKAQLFWGTHVERDFVEAPSQMLENWVKEKGVLARMSGHYKTGETIPEIWVEKLKKADIANAGYKNLRQIVFATFDQKIHQSCDVLCSQDTISSKDE